jgi:hypothetical protein
MLEGQMNSFVRRKDDYVRRLDEAVKVKGTNDGVIEGRMNPLDG